jgi:hypothetical protein
VSDETPDVIYGRLLEARDMTAYTLDRYLHEVKSLLTSNRYRELSAGFRDVNAFIRSVDFSGYNLGDMRPEIARMIKELQPEASNRAIADALGVTDMTVGRDLAAATDVAEPLFENSDVEDDSPTNVASILDRYPELGQFGIPPASAVVMAATLDRLPEDVRERKREAIRTHQPGILAELAGLPPMPTPHKEDQDEKQKAYWHQSCNEIVSLLKRIEADEFFRTTMRLWSLKTQQQQLLAMKRLVKTLEPIIKGLESALQKGASRDARA